MNLNNSTKICLKHTLSSLTRESSARRTTAWIPSSQLKALIKALKGSLAEATRKIAPSELLHLKTEEGKQKSAANLKTQMVALMKQLLNKVTLSFLSSNEQYQLLRLKSIEFRGNPYVPRNIGLTNSILLTSPRRFKCYSDWGECSQEETKDSGCSARETRSGRRTKRGEGGQSTTNSKRCFNFQPL